MGRKKTEAWFLYVLECGDGSFYTGVTKDVAERIKTHNRGRGAAYTRSRLPVKLIYQESCRDRSSALIRELKVKAMTHEEKGELAKN